MYTISATQKPFQSIFTQIRLRSLHSFTERQKSQGCFVIFPASTETLLRIHSTETSRYDFQVWKLIWPRKFGSTSPTNPDHVHARASMWAGNFVSEFSTTFSRCNPKEEVHVSHTDWSKYVSDDDEDSALLFPSVLDQADHLWEDLSAERCWPVRVCVWRQCLAPSSPDSLMGKLWAGSVLFFILVSHTGLASYCNVLLRGQGKGQSWPASVYFPVVSWIPLERLVLFNFVLFNSSVCCTTKQLLCLKWKHCGGQQTKRKQEASSGQWHYTYLVQLLCSGILPRTLCLKSSGWFTLESGWEHNTISCNFPQFSCQFICWSAHWATGLVIFDNNLFRQHNKVLFNPGNILSLKNEQRMEL